MAFKQERPIVFFDLETTGVNVVKDRIVEISVVKVFPGTLVPQEYVKRVNPGMPIPAEATAVHHISDADVKDAPTFAMIASEVAELFRNSDIAGFNSNQFDMPLLLEEFSRAGVVFDRFNANLIDVQTLYHKKEPRTLSAAYKFYCGKDLADAHSALADTRATCEVFFAQLERYPDLPDTAREMAQFTQHKRNIDLAGRFVRNDNGEVVFNFGKHKGKSVKEVVEKLEPGYIDWMMTSDFPMDTKQTALRLKNSLRTKH